jgi:hypothetical protein
MFILFGTNLVDLLMGQFADRHNVGHFDPNAGTSLIQIRWGCILLANTLDRLKYRYTDTAQSKLYFIPVSTVKCV